MVRTQIFLIIEKCFRCALGRFSGDTAPKQTAASSLLALAAATPVNDANVIQWDNHDLALTQIYDEKHR